MTAMPPKGYLTGMTNATTDLQDGTDYAMADVAAGHFTSSSDARVLADGHGLRR